MSTSASGGSQVRAWWTVVLLSSRRVGWSLQTLAAVAIILVLGILVGAITVVAAQQGRAAWTFVTFTQNILAGLYLTFILPLVCLCFGTQVIGGDWEEKSLVWLLTRPLPRAAIYLAKYVAALPWVLGLALGGLFFVGALAGPPAQPTTPIAVARTLSERVVVATVDPPDLNAASTVPQGWPGVESAWAFWPVAVWGALAYLALFQLLGAWFRRSTIIGVAYTFVLEVIVTNMPGLLKRASIGFYNRCMLYGMAERQDWDYVQGQPALVPPRDTIFLPIPYDDAWQTLLVMTLILLLLGAWLFHRQEYKDLT